MDSAELRKGKEESVNLTNREVSSSNNIEKKILKQNRVSDICGATLTIQPMYIGRSRKRKQSNRINI